MIGPACRPPFARWTPSAGPALLALVATMLVGLLASPDARAGEFKQSTKVRAVVLGGSISMYFKGNYGQFLEYGCKNLEVVNRAKVGAGGPALLKRLDAEVLNDAALMKELTGAGEAWLIFQGGLNSVWSPWMTNDNLARLFAKASGAGLRTFALTLTPWGEDGDRRFDGWEGVWTHRATRKINNFLLGRITPDVALGSYGKDHPHEWMKGELPTVAVDLWDAGLQDSGAELRAAAPLALSFATSRYRKETAQRANLLAEARAVPRHYLKAELKDFDHIHPNTDGHRLIALAACRRAPATWGCDCGKIARAQWKGKVVEGK